LRLVMWLLSLEILLFLHEHVPKLLMPKLPLRLLPTKIPMLPDVWFVKISHLSDFSFGVVMFGFACNVV